MLLNSFLIRFREFYFLTPSDDFAKAKAFAWRPFLPIVKMVSYLNITCFFERFLHRISIVCL